ncbi:MAG: hypothetical protein IPK50_09935 [Fibrobacterota bacterium]|nr:hypothetical protein [Fibrobacterota bacterium]QQS07197.1 MAG: hypothetical protein IPK50_09935 [Fibrobacterota bacterium]
MKSNVSKVAMCALSLAAASQANVMSATSITISDRTMIFGDITSGTTTQLGGGGAVQTKGSITSCGAVTIRDGSSMNGLFYASTVSPATTDWNVRNIRSSRPPVVLRSCSAPVIQTVTATPGTIAINVADGASRTITPGAYGLIKLGNSHSKLLIKSGTYQIDSLYTSPYAEIEFESGVRILVAKGVDLGNFTNLHGDGAGAASIEVKRNFRSGTDMTIPMAILSNGTIDIRDRVNFNRLTGNKVLIGTDCNQIKPIISPDDMITSFEDHFDRAAEYIGNNENSLDNDPVLTAKWNILRGTIDVVKRESRFGFLVGNTSIIPNPDPQGYVVDLEGSSWQSPAKLETSKAFAPGKYLVSYRLAGNNRQGGDTYWVDVSFGPGYKVRTTKAFDQPFGQAITAEVTITQPEKFVIDAGRQGASVRANMLLDDVVIRQIP